MRFLRVVTIPISFQAAVSVIKVIKNREISAQLGKFLVILEEPYNLFKHRRFGGMAEIWVTNWQPCLFLRFATSCFQVTRFIGQR